MSKGPSVALFGPSGFVGKEVTPAFLDALDSNQISSLTLFSREPSSAKHDAFRHRSAKFAEATFHDRAVLTESLRGVDIVVSTLGTKGVSKEDKQTMIEAAAAAGVKFYIPSELGTDHRNIRWHQPMFVAKQEHRAAAEQLGLKTIAIYPGFIMEVAFSKLLGFDTKARTWNLIGPGDVPFSMVSQRDLGPIVLHTALLAHRSPSQVPSDIRLYSDNRSLLAYKEIFESVSGEKLKVVVTPVEEAAEHYEKTKSLIPPGMLGSLLNLLAADGSFNHGDAGPANRELINPGEKNFKWKTMDEYAREVGGLPWENSLPF